MRTSKPISTISYNSETYLKGKLEELRGSGAITWWAYIRHTAEADEKKDHWHVLVSPNRILDTGALGAMFKELDPSHPDKPLGCIEWRTSKRDEWLLYSIHDQLYLASKVEKREFAYDLEDVVTSDRDELEELERSARREGKWARDNRIIRGIVDGDYTLRDLIASGAVPLAMLPSVRALVNILANPAELIRREVTHTPKDAEEGTEIPQTDTGVTGDPVTAVAPVPPPSHVVQNGRVLTKKQIDKQLDHDQRAVADGLRKDSLKDGTRERVGRQMTLEDYDLSRGFTPLSDDAELPFD